MVYNYFNRVIDSFGDDYFGKSISFILLFIPLLGIHGLAFNKKHLHHVFWKIYSLFYLYSLLKGILFVNPNYFTIAVSTPFQFIEMIGLFTYAFSWNKLFKAEKKGY
jgi:hypothetical protein